MKPRQISIRRKLAFLVFAFLLLAGPGIHGPLYAQPAPAPQIAAPPPLFASAPLGEARETRAVTSPNDPVDVLRSRSAGIDRETWSSVLRNPASLGTAPDPSSPALLLNLFADTSLPFYLDRVAVTADGIGSTVYGRVGADNQGTAIFTLYGGAVSGLVRLRTGEFYDFFVPTSGAGELRQVAFRGYTAPSTDAVPVPEARDLPRPLAAEIPLDLPRQAGSLSTVDLLVAYTARARQARGDAAGMQAHINQVIAECNAAFAASAVDVEFRLAHAVEVAYDDSNPSFNYGTALEAIQGTSDGTLDAIHALRNQYAADLVSLWVNPPVPNSGSFTVGQAYLLTGSVSNFANFAFSVANQAYAGGSSSTFAHEAGHNLGLNHDVDNGGTSGGIYPDARGYQQKTLNPKFYTIMAYFTNCAGCSPLSQFSNPAVSYQSIPTGVTGSADAARALNYVGPFAAAWRGGVTPACAYTLSPASVSPGSSGGSYTATVTTTSGCAWTPSSSAAWVSLGSTGSRFGSGSFSYTVAANASSSARSASVSAGGRSLSITQSGAIVLPTLTVTGAPVSLSSPSGATRLVEASLTVAAGGAAVPVTVSGTLPSWLSVSRTSFQTPATLTLSANPTALPVGIYSATVRFASSATLNPAVNVAVSFEIKSSTRPRVSARALSFRTTPFTEPATQTLLIQADGTVTDVSLAVGNAPWLSATRVLVGDTWQFTVRADARSLPAALYDADLQILCAPVACNPGIVPVRLAVQAVSGVGGSPRIGSGGIVNAASFQQGISAGSWMSAFGTNLSSTTRTWQSADFQENQLPLNLDNVRVRVNGEAAAVHFIGPGQVNFQAPSSLPEGWVTVEILAPAGSDTAYVYAGREHPGFFEFDSAGNVAALHPDGVPVGDSGAGAAYAGRPAFPGVVLAFYGTGFGPTTPSVPAGQIYQGAAPLTFRDRLAVTIGGLPASIQFAGITAAGLNQINVAVPNLPAGSHRVLASIDGVPTQFRGRIIVR